MENSAELGPDRPGHYLHLSNAAYHAGPGVSKSQLDHLHNAPALLEWSRKAPRDEEAKAAVDLGDAFHAMALEPDRFDDEFVGDFKPPAGAISSTDELKMAMDERGIPYLSKDTKPALVRKLLDMDPDAPVTDRLREEWAEGVNGRAVLTAEEFRKVQLMRDSAMAHPFARLLLEAEGDVEASTYWIDPATGVLCRCRKDKLVRLPNGRRIILDVKTTGDIEKFSASIEDYRYHVQDAFYSEGYDRHFGAPADGFVFLVVSTKRDAGRYPVRCFSLDAEDKLAGRNDFRKDLDTYAECLETGHWPGVETISRPMWARRAAA